MLGILRYLLALMVVLSHLWYDLMWWQGSYAVFFFYIISGYLMCLVINETYTGSDGAARYALNRVLRIYPVYLVVLFLSILVTINLGSFLSQPLGNGLSFSNVMPLPDSFKDWLANISLLFTPAGNAFHVSPAWSLRVELFFYAAMLLLTRRLWLVLVWLAASIAYIGWMEHQGVAFMDRYATISGASIAFALGGLVYYLRRFKPLPYWHIPIAVLAYFLHLWFAPDIWGFPRKYQTVQWFFEGNSFGLYGNVILGGYLLHSIVSRGRSGPMVHKLGGIAGNLAYPIFLLHWVAAALILQSEIAFTDKATFIPAALLLVNLLAYLAYLSVEAPINQKLRDRIRSK
jgi:peptidoglycan/LPS O-acetylase OafA/YrhL